MQITTNIKLQNILKVQKLVKQYNWRFEFCIENINNFRVCINSNGNSIENINKFCQSLYSIDYIYTESVRKHSILKKFKINLRKGILYLRNNISVSEATS